MLKWKLGIVLLIGIVSVSCAAIFIRLAIALVEVKSIGFSLFVAASRLIFASFILIPIWKQLRQDRVSPKAYYFAVAAGLSLALHFASWITSLSFTSIAASTTLVTTNPIWVALISWFWWKEKPKKLTLLGIAVALVGSIIIAFGDPVICMECDRSINTEKFENSLLGNILATIGAFMASLYFLFGTQAQNLGLTISSYIAIAYTTAALILLPLPLLFGSSYFGYPNLVYIYVLLMAIVSQLIGHTSFNWAVKYVSPTLVSLTILFEPLGASLLGFFIFKEVPSSSVLTGGVILLLGVGIAVVGTRG
jgi:drug/metabolite transporter (DMT)-like permease